MFVVSDNGTALYMTGASGAAQLQMGTIGSPLTALPVPSGQFRGVHFSPDGRRIVYGADNQLFVHDLAVGTRIPLLPRGWRGWDPLWSPDGKSISFHCHRRNEIAQKLE